MKRFQFEVREEVITPIEVMADNEQEARELVFRQDSGITPFERVWGDMRVVLRTVSDD